MSPSLPPSEARNAGTRLLVASFGFALALLLALGAAHWYVRPENKGGASRGIWTEADFLCALASSALALEVGAWSGRAARGAGATAARSFITRAALWLAFTLFFGVLWLDSVSLFTLLIAPTHAFTSLRLLGLWSHWRADRIWRSQR
jgi:hypothetical protein